MSGLFANSIRMAMRNLVSNTWRSVLTLLGVIFGVGIVILIVSMGEGLRAAFTGAFASYGNNWIIIMPQAVQQGGQAYGQGRIEPFKIQDANALKAAKHLDFVLPMASMGMNAKYANKNMGVEVSGVLWEYYFGPGVKVVEGRAFNQGEQKSLKRVAVLGATVRKRLFSEHESPIGKIIKLGGNSFTVIGVLEAKGSLDNTDNQVGIPLTTFQARVSGSDDIFAIIGVAPDIKSLELAREEVRQILRQRRHLSDPTQENFQIMSLDDALKFANQFLNTIIFVFGFIALIALLVAGIGIMNIMLVTVTERTREIGLRMALGASRRSVLLQFLLEAALLTVIGGAIGILFGWGFGLIVGAWLSKLMKLEFTATVPVLYATIAVTVCIMFGLIFGMWPAYRASSLDPVVAMRKE